MIQKFKLSSIALSVAEDKIYDETTTFNEQNINEYLAEVEEYIKCMLAVMSKELGYEHPMLMALGLEELPKKIEPPVFPKEPLVDEEEDEEEPDDVTLNNMLDKSKFDVMMVERMEKIKEITKSRSMMQESQDVKLEDTKVDDSKDAVAYF